MANELIAQGIILMRCPWNAYCVQNVLSRRHIRST